MIEITKFGGEDREDLVEWMDNWNRAAAANGWTLEEEQVMLPLYLTNRASQHYRNIPQRIKSDITLLKKELEDHLNSPSQKLQCRNLLGERYQKPQESVADFYEDICRLVQRGWSQKSPDFMKDKSLEYFIKGLRPTIKKIFWGEEVEDLDIAYQKARTRELYLVSKKGKGEIRAIDAKQSEMSRDSSREFSELLASMKALMDDQKQIIALQRKNLENPPQPVANYTETRDVKPKAFRPRRMDIDCWNC